MQAPRAGTSAPFDLGEARALLARTPALLTAWLLELPAAWLSCDEGPSTWNAITIVGHLVEGERSDWIPRVKHVLKHGDAVAFPPFDRFSQLRRGPVSLAALLDEFAAMRGASLQELDALRLTPAALQSRGRHPEFGVVTLAQHLATWVAHDLTHITQIARVMAKRYATAVGPWRAYLRVLSDAPAGA